MVKLQYKRTSKDGRLGSYFITLPKILVESVLGWEPGEELEITYIEYEGKKGLFVSRK